MALKSDRRELDTDISFFMDEVAEKGYVVCYSTAGSGAAMDDSNAVVTIPAHASGTPVGILLNDMVNIDQTRQHINWHKDERQKGDKVTILKKGYVVTNAISGTPAGGDPAYVVASGLIGNAAGSGGGSTQIIGRFKSSKDSDGYCTVDINLP